MRTTYQLVRNVLAVCVRSEKDNRDFKNGHAVLLYDERNPAFADNKCKGFIAWEEIYH